MITWIEVMTGAANEDEESVLRAFLSNFTCLPTTCDVAECAAANRRQKKIKLPDAIILATAEMAKRNWCPECEGFSGKDVWGEDSVQGLNESGSCSI